MSEQLLVPLELIDPNPWQTRQSEDPAHVDEIAHSIKAMGMMQIPSARKLGERFQLVFGHTRLAAYRLLNTLGQEGFDRFPINLHDIEDEQMAVAAFEENEKRRDLNPVEKAKAIQKMLNDFGWTQELIAEKLHIDRSGVSNMLRMLRLPDLVLDSVASGIMPVRSAMALLPIYDFSDKEVMDLYSRYSFDLAEFEALARNGEINSDSIRLTVEKYSNFLHPTQLKLEVELPMTVPEEPGGGSTVIESDVITATEQQAYPEPVVPAAPAAVQAEIADWTRAHENEEHNEQENPTNEEEKSAGGNSGPASFVGAQTDEPATPPVETKPDEKPVPAPLPEPDDPNEILFTITYKTNGVIVGVRKQGKIPQLRMLQNLLPEEVPALMHEMGID